MASSLLHNPAFLWQKAEEPIRKHNSYKISHLFILHRKQNGVIFSPLLLLTPLNLTDYLGPHLSGISNNLPLQLANEQPAWFQVKTIPCPRTASTSQTLSETLQVISYPFLLFLGKGKKTPKNQQQKRHLLDVSFPSMNEQGKGIYQALLMSMLCFPQLCPGEYIFLWHKKAIVLREAQ